MGAGSRFYVSVLCKYAHSSTRRKNMSFSMKKIIHTKFFQRKDAFYHGLLTRNVILITGASRGIGKAIAEQFLQENATVVLVSRNLEDLKKTFEKHKDEQMLLLEADISQEKDVKKIIQAVIDKYGKIDLLVNNAVIFSATLIV